MFNFAWPWVLVCIVLPFFVRFFKSKQVSEEQPLYLPTFGLVSDSNQTISRRSFPWVLLLIWCCLVVAAAKPQWLGEPVTIPQEGREMMLAVDLSGSMDQNDMIIGRQQVNRLTMLKYVLNDFIERRVGDRLGLILFADTAYVQTPLTYDRTTVKTLLNEAVLGLVGEKTAIGDALGLAAKRFNDKGESNRVLILLTDGQNTAGNIDPLEALEIAKEAGIRVYTIGIGADEMMVRSIFGTRKVNPSAELDERLLNKIAEDTGGKYFRARDTEELQTIYELLDELEPVEDDPIQLRPQQALFHYPLGLALLLSLLMTVIPLLQQKWRSFNQNTREEK